HARDADGYADVDARHGGTGNQQPCGANSGNEPFFHVSLPCCASSRVDEMSLLSRLLGGRTCTKLLQWRQSATRPPCGRGRLLHRNTSFRQGKAAAEII